MLTNRLLCATTQVWEAKTGGMCRHLSVCEADGVVVSIIDKGIGMHAVAGYSLKVSFHACCCGCTVEP